VCSAEARFLGGSEEGRVGGSFEVAGEVEVGGGSWMVIGMIGIGGAGIEVLLA